MVKERKMQGSLNERPLFPFRENRVLSRKDFSFFLIEKSRAVPHVSLSFNGKMVGAGLWVDHSEVFALRLG